MKESYVFKNIYEEHDPAELQSAAEDSLSIRLKRDREKLAASGYLLEKTEHLTQLERQSEQLASQILSKYGIEVDVSDKTIDWIEKGSLIKYTDGKLQGGKAVSLYDYVVVEQKGTDIDSLATCTHELLHTASKRVLRRGSRNQIELHRKGIQIFDVKNDTAYFSNLEEGIVTILTDEVFDNLAQDERYNEKIQQSNRLKSILENNIDAIFGFNPPQLIMVKKVLEHLDYIEIDKGEVDEIELMINSKDKNDEYVAGYLIGLFKRKMDSGMIIESPRPQLKSKVWDFCETIRSSATDEYETKEDVFRELVQAHFTGEGLMSIARKLERILDKGSLRKYAIEFSSPF